MATRYNNTVPLGQEGTGAAQILGPNRALQYALNKNEREQERLHGEQQQYQKRRQSQNDQFQKTLYEMNELANTPMFQNEFGDLVNGLVSQGAEMMSQGINPYNSNQSPESRDAIQQWQSDVNKARQAKSTIEEYHGQRKKDVERWSSNPEDYDFNDYQKVKDFEKNFDLLDIIEGRAEYPTLQQKLDIGKFISSRHGEVYNQGTVMDVDESGNPIRRDVKQADIPRIEFIVNNEFQPGTPAAAEVDRRLRSEFGEGASVAGLLGTTDREELRSVIDAQMRNDTSEDSPLVTLMSSGEIPSLDSDEYDAFLERSVDEQVKAEQMLKSAKEQAANTLYGKVNARDTWRFDYSVENQERSRRAEQRAQASHATSQRKANLSIDKLMGEIEGQDIKNIKDVSFISDNDTDIVLAGATGGGSTTEFEYNPTRSSYNINSQDFDTNPRSAARLIAVGVSAVNKNTGQVLPGDPRNYIGDPNTVFESRAQVRATTTRSGRERKVNYFEDPSVISTSMAGENKKFAERAIQNSNRVLSKFNEEHNAALSGDQEATKETQTKTPAELMREAANRQ